MVIFLFNMIEKFESIRYARSDIEAPAFSNNDSRESDFVRRRACIEHTTYELGKTLTKIELSDSY